MPDLLEPANDPDHRSFFHSKIAALGLASLVTKTNESEQNNDGVKLLANIASAGYLSHLLLDNTTPKGLPLLY